ncbi:MAG: FemAB-related protein (PEP-CTERM system-associated) [Gammaproteobacteria bacterium]
MNSLNVTVRSAEERDLKSWDEYVNSHEEATFFHLSGWKRVFERSFNHRTHYLMCESDGVLLGVLPLVCVNSLLFGKSLSSLAFCAYGGVLASSDEAFRQLETAAIELARELKVGALEFRYRRASGVDRVGKDLYEYFSKPIDPDPDVNMKAIRSKQRNIIRKGIKNGLTARVDTVDSFYTAFSESVRNLGTPVFPKKLFYEIAEAFPDQVEFLSAFDGDTIVSSSLLYYFRDEVCPYYWGGVEAARRLKGNDYLCWEIMCRAASRGCTLFDFGRSKKGTGSYKWKENLGFESHPLYYEYELIESKEMPNINPMNPKYRFFVEAWKHLPLPVTRVVGPWLAKDLG